MGSQRRRIVITRPAHQAHAWVERFEKAGFDVVLLPLLEVVKVDDDGPLCAMAAELAEATENGRDAWLAVTSANAVDPLCDRLPSTLDWRAIRAASVGRATADALRRRGLAPRLVGQGTAADLAHELVEVLAQRKTKGTKVFVPQAADARPDLVQGLRAAGIEVEVAVAYDKVLPAGTVERAREIFADEIGLVTFTSPRIVRHFMQVLEQVPDGLRRLDELEALSIGPVTSAALAAVGIEAVVLEDADLEDFS